MTTMTTMTASPGQDRSPLGRGLVLALALSLAGGAMFVALNSMLAAGAALRVLVMLLAAAYLTYLLAGSRQRIGRMATIVIWCAVSAALWFAWPPISLYVLVHVAMLWIARSLYRYSGFLPVLADLCLNALALAFAYWAATRTGSAFIALWCFFLAQALHVLIPEQIRNIRRRTPAPDSGQAFGQAHRSAEDALRRLVAQR